MATIVQQKLNEFYLQKGIHPQNFRCKNQAICKARAYQGNMLETKMSLIGSRYGEGYPRIVVVSLDPPSAQGVFEKPHQRTVESIAAYTESEDYSLKRPNPHWAMTQIIVKDLLSLWGYEAQPYAAETSQSYSMRPIENVTAHFAHVNVAKCSMNNPGGGQSPKVVHILCSHAYLLDELVILAPDILVTQGVAPNQILGNMLIGRSISEAELPTTGVVRIGRKPTFWMPMHHPTRQQNKIRLEWSYYIKAIRNWQM